MTREETGATAPFWVETLDEPGQVRLGLAEGVLEGFAAEGRAVEILGLELAAVGTRVRPGETLGFLTLPERMMDLRAPFAMQIERRNDAALADPRLVRDSPALRGWLLEARRQPRKNTKEHEKYC